MVLLGIQVEGTHVQVQFVLQLVYFEEVHVHNQVLLLLDNNVEEVYVQVQVVVLIAIHGQGLIYMYRVCLINVVLYKNYFNWA